MNVFVSIYNPVDLFPPTINAIEELSRKYTSVTLLTNGSSKENQWIFPENVKLFYFDNWSENRTNRGTVYNIRRFLKYMFQLKAILGAEEFDIVLLYEPHAALAYKAADKFIRKFAGILWYHNHDIIEKKNLRKYTIGWFAARAEQKIFKELDIFSLPADERKMFFPLKNFTGKYFFLPNYPSVRLYKKYYNEKIITNEIRLVYQGRVAEGHGLEELIKLLRKRISGKKVSLHLKGICEPAYFEKLQNIAEKFNVQNDLFFYELTSYLEVPKLVTSCHIGIGIHTKTDVMNSTLGTSSNKIYEYAAVGLPVLIYDNDHFREHLGKNEWAIFTDCSELSLKNCIEKIIENYSVLSKKAHSDFMDELNFENKFSSITKYINQIK